MTKYSVLPMEILNTRSTELFIEMCWQDFWLGLCGNMEAWFSHVVHLGGQQRGHNSQTRNKEVRRGSEETAPCSKPLPLRLCCCHYSCCWWQIWAECIELSEMWYPTKGHMRREYGRRGNAFKRNLVVWASVHVEDEAPTVYLASLAINMVSVTCMVFPNLAKPLTIGSITDSEI